MPPTVANGKICYLEIPASDVPRSVRFYESVFGWKTRKRGDGATAFDDSGWQLAPPIWNRTHTSPYEHCS